jgi:SAM-dependent methyltransferase
MTDYDAGWTHQWNDMIRYSPAPFHRRRLILELADEISFESVLDAGCGNAELLLAIARQRALRRVIGLDVAQSVTEGNRVAFPAFEFHHVDIGVTFLPIECDLVVCSEVIEHIVDWERALRHLRSMCARHLILTVPTGPVFPIDRMMGHHRHFSWDELSAGLARARFVVDRALRWGFPFHTLYKRAINLAPGASVERFSNGRYGSLDRMVARVLIALFYLNSHRRGLQLVVRAHAV